MSQSAADEGQWAEELPLKDSRTGLPSQLIFRDRLQQAVFYAKRYRTSLAVLVVNINDLNVVNTPLSPSVGDLLLCVLAERLSNTVRNSDAVGRLSGASFTVLLSNIRDATDAAHVAEKLLTTLSSPVQLSDRDVCVNASMGIAVFPGDGVDADMLIRTADSAMQELKRSGKPGFKFYAPELASRAAERLQLEADLRRAVAENEFEVHYQPTVDTGTAQIVSAEALIRWNHPTKGPIPPSVFIPIAEKNGLIVSIGEWVASVACKDAREWQQLGRPPITLSINVSLRQLEQANFMETLMHCLVSSNLDSQLLQVELTESLFLRDHRYVKSVLERLRDLGITIAIDDFGTGYSSLSQLMKLPIDTLKIDRSFVSGIPDEHDALVIVEAMVQLGRNLSLNVIAEGVEDVEQYEFLREVGCHQCQGYLIGKPVRTDDFVNYLTGCLSIPATGSSGGGALMSARR